MRTQRMRQRGFSLVELMVSITISLVILAALVAIFVNSSASNRELARANSMIENGRLAIQVLEHDVVHSAYWAGYVPRYDDHTFDSVPPDAPTAIPDPCLAFSAGNWNNAYKTNLLAIALQAYDANPVGTCGVVTNPLAGNDILLVRHADTCVAGAANCPAVAAGTLYFQHSRCNLDVNLYVLDTAGHNLRQRNCATAASLRRFMSNIYYVRNFAVTAGDGIPTLMRSQFNPAAGALAHQPAQPLIEGIERFRVEFGVDSVSKTGAAVNNAAAIVFEDPATKERPTNRGDGAPDGAFVRCTAATPCTAAQLANVTAVKITVLARSREPSRGHRDTKTYDLGGGATAGPFNDAFKRHLFVTTVRLPNVAGRRETP